MKPYNPLQRLGARVLCAALLLLPVFAGTTGIVFAQATQPGAVYTLTNRPDGNEVLVFARGADGSLTLAGSYATGGSGTGSGLGSQSAVIVSNNHQWLFAVNAGSNSISSFRIRPDQILELAETIPSGGSMPISLTFYNGLLYVLNAGVPNNITGFKVDFNGTLMPLSNSTRPLSADSTDPAQVNFDKTGKTVIVTEKATNQIDTYSVGKDGRLTGPFVHPSAGPVPFGFALDNQNTVLVSDAGPGGGASSYRVGDDGSLTPVSPNVVTGQEAACWVGVTNNGQYGYVVNAGTGNISGFAIGPDGSASLLDADGVTAITGGNPTDIALSIDSRFLYVLVTATSSIARFAIGADGSLEPLTQVGTPSGLAGLAGY
ncbi:MAG TPA: beta-propeller fold lactonase family protein [Anaerolineales bacterium]|nr:beta-propeller fold lactonase family protein [Anaerolineales bacterium]